jgi:hypothetical protein
MKSVKPWIASAGVVGVAAAGVFLAGQDADPVRTPQSGSAETISVGDWVARSDTAGREVRAQAERVFESIAGSQYEADALAVVQAYSANGDMDVCMDDAGYPAWDWSLSRHYTPPRDPLNSSEWLDEPLKRWRSVDLLVMRPFLEAEVIMNHPSVGQDEAITECLGSIDPRSEEVLDPAAPRLIERLTLKWYDMVREAEERFDLPPTSRYLDCMDAADISALDDEGLPANDNIGPAMSALGPDDDHIPHSLDDTERWNSAGWQRLLAGEDELVEADWACREDVYVQAIEKMAPLIDAFVEEHRADLAAVREAWEQIVAKAEQLGYTGEPGPLGG